MKPPLLLKTILDICLYLLMLSLFASIIFFFFQLANGENLIPVTINGVKVVEFDIATKILVFIEMLVAALFIYAVYILRKLISNFFKGQLFTRFQIASLKIIGQLIILTTLIQGIINFVAPLITTGKGRIGIEVGFSFGSFWFILSIGLFFIFLSKVFENAKKLKEENELTV